MFYVGSVVNVYPSNKEIVVKIEELGIVRAYQVEHIDNYESGQQVSLEGFPNEGFVNLVLKNE